MNELSALNWPPAYRIRRDRRAKRVKLHASSSQGLQITIPQRFSLKHLPFILEENRDWIIKKLEQRLLNPPSLPKELYLQAINQIWHVEYFNHDGKANLKQNSMINVLQLFGNQNEQAIYLKQLLNWIKKNATPFLQERLQHISQQIGLKYSSLSIRQQKTLWGSCTINKKINLNMKLIFLPLELVDYIIIHELCHTVYLNHSNLFWNLVARFDPIYLDHRRMMRKADGFIPVLLR